MSEDICFSGGARGADTIFGLLAAKTGHAVVHFSFFGHTTECPKDTVLFLHEEELLKADPYLNIAAKKLGRTFPTKSDYTNNLLRRNYYQVANTKRVYAVSPLDKEGKIVGGTAWAVQIAIQLGVKEIFLFDCFAEKWYSYDSMAEWDDYWKPINLLHIPRPNGSYTGIGTRDLPSEGISAIESLYGIWL